MKDDRILIDHILDSISALSSWFVNGTDLLLSDRKTRKAALRELQEIAESAGRLSAPLREANREVPWSAINGFRNVLVHDYLGLDIRAVLKNPVALPSLCSDVE